MRLWTIQGIAIYEQLQKEGVAYCTHPGWSDYEEIMHAYRTHDNHRHKVLYKNNAKAI